METFVSDLLENADLWEITKKDVRNKYKKFLGRDISAEEKAKINDLVYAFVYYYAAKEKTSEEVSQRPTKSACIISDKENKQKHVKEKLTKGSNLNSAKRSHALTGQVTDRNNIKQFTKMKSATDKEYKEHGQTDNRSPRKVYPIRKRNLSTKLQLADAVSAIMKSESESSSDQSETESSDSESEYEKDEAEKKQIECALRNLNNAREIRIKMAKAKKQTDEFSAVVTGNSKPKIWKEEGENCESSKKSSPVVISDSDSIVLLSDFDPMVGEREYKSEDSVNCLKEKQQMNTDEIKKRVNMGVTKKEGTVNSNDTKKGGTVSEDSTKKGGTVSEDSTKKGGTVREDSSKKGGMVSEDNTKKGGTVKRKGGIESVVRKKKEGMLEKKVNLLKGRIKSETRQMQKKKKKSVEDGKKTNSTESGDSGKINVKKTMGNYSKVKTPWHKVIEEGLGIKKNKFKQIIVIKTESESEIDNPVTKKSTISGILKADVEQKKITDKKRIMNLVRKKREAAAMKKLKKETEEESNSSEGDKKWTDRHKIMNLVRKKREAGAIKRLNKERKEKYNSSEVKQTEETETEHESNTEACDYLEQISDSSSLVKSTDNDSDLISDRTQVTGDIDGSAVVMLEDVDVEMNDTDTPSGCDSSHTQCTDTDSPLKTTPSQLSKKKKRKMELVSDDDSSWNEIYIVSEDTSDEDEPLSQTRAKIREKKMGQAVHNPATHHKGVHESPHLLQLRKICRASGIFVRSDRELKGCFTNDDKIMALKKVLKDAGMKGQPSIKKAEELKLQKEVAELNTENIITTETGRGFRNVRSIYARPKVQPSMNTTPETNKPGIFSRLKGILDSESSG